MQRYSLIETGGLQGKAMADDKEGRWVKYDEIQAIEKRLAKIEKLSEELGYNSPEHALDDLLNRVGN